LVPITNPLTENGYVCTVSTIKAYVAYKIILHVILPNKSTWVIELIN